MKFDLEAFLSSNDKNTFEIFYQNNSNKEICNKYDISFYQLNKILNAWNIPKKDKNTINNLISETLKTKSDSERLEIQRKRKITESNRTAEQQEEICKNRSAGRLSRTEDQKQHQLDCFRKTCQSRSDVEKQLIKKHRSDATKKRFQEMSDDQRKQFSEKMKQTYAEFSDDKKKARSQKIRDAAIKNGNINNFSDPGIREQIKNTNLSRYNVPWYRMTQDCRSALGGNSANSKPNQEFKRLLEQAGIVEFETEFPLENYSYDFKINDILIEIDPTITHNSTTSPFGEPKDKNYHYNKSSLAKKYSYRCIHVWDWDDVEKIIDLLKNRQTVYARKCRIEEIDSKACQAYLSQHHLQGYARSKINIGLFYQDELVSVMTFDKPRYNKRYDYELVRYCSHCNVIGGAQKLFKYFLATYNPMSIVSYCDLAKFSGKVYTELDFELENHAISKHWYNPKSKQHITDNLLRQRGFDQLFRTNYGKGTSNEILMLQAGFLEIYDAGQATYIWTKEHS